MADSRVIARRFRPQAFDEVVGQEAITRTLRNSIQSGRVHHAYLFTGARGVGKTTTARILAKALNCGKGITTEPCGTCPSCLEIATSSSLDVHEIDAASHTGIDNVREVIISTVQINPARDRYKIFIIDEVHQLSSSAFNALLKTIEEPPPHVVFVMATTEMHKVPETILSRCQIFEFRTIATGNIFGQLRKIATDLGIDVSDGALLAIARAGEGSMRDAESALDQVISFAGNRVADGDVSAALGLVDTQTLVEIMQAIAGQDAQQTIRLVDEVVSRGYDLRNLCRELMVFVRGLLVVKAVGFDQELVQMPAEESEAIVALAESFSEQDLIRFFSLLVKTEQDIRLSSQPRFHLEIGLMKLVQATRLYMIEDALARIADLQSRLGVSGTAPARLASGAGARSAPAAPPAGANRSSAPRSAAPPRVTGPRSSVGGDGAYRERGSDEYRESSSQPGTGPDPTSRQPAASARYELAAEEPPPFLAEPDQTRGSGASHISKGHSNTGGQEEAESILGLVEARGKMMLLSALDHAESVAVDGDLLRVSYSEAGVHFKNKLEAREARRSLEELAREALGRPIVLAVAVGAQSPASAKKQDAADARREAETHPAVRSVVDLFHGEVIEVIKPE